MVSRSVMPVPGGERAQEVGLGWGCLGPETQRFESLRATTGRESGQRVSGISPLQFEFVGQSLISVWFLSFASSIYLFTRTLGVRVPLYFPDLIRIFNPPSCSRLSSHWSPCPCRFDEGEGLKLEDRVKAMIKNCGQRG